MALSKHQNLSKLYVTKLAECENLEDLDNYKDIDTIWSPANARAFLQRYSDLRPPGQNDEDFADAEYWTELMTLCFTDEADAEPDQNTEVGKF